MKLLHKNVLILPFETTAKWKNWLSKNHVKSDGIWLQIFKKNSKQKTINYAEALAIVVTTPFDLKESVAEKYIREKSQWLLSKIAFFWAIQRPGYRKVR